MAKIPDIKTNFTAGELSEKLLGRVDIARYTNGAEIMENVHPLVQGGAKRRGGTRFVKPAKNADKHSVLVGFVFSNSQAYMLEFGDLYMRVYRNRARVEVSLGVAYEIVTPFTEAMLSELTFTQRGDTMFIAHGSIPIQRLKRYDDDLWIIGNAPFDPLPFAELGFFLPVSATFSATTVGTGRTLTAVSPVFLASDVGREIWGAEGICKVTGYTSTTIVTVEITVAFPATVWATGLRMRDSPRTDCTPSEYTPVGKALTLTLAAAGWRATDVGKHVQINGGLVEITGFTSTTVVNGTIRKELIAASASPSEAWTLEAPAWNADDGYPRAVCLHQQALFAAGSTAFPQTLWRSKIGFPLDFTMGVDDSDAFDYAIDAEQNNILHIFPMKKLAVMSYAGSSLIYGGVEKPIAPTNIQIDPDGDQGVSTVRPVRAGKELLFVQRSGQKVFSLSYTYSSDEFDDNELSILADHLTAPGIVGMAYQQQPWSIVWMPRADGVMASLTLNRKQDVLGWARHTTDGEFESAATIPGADGDEVWCVVKRTIDGNEVRYIELFDEDLQYADCAVTGTSGPGAATWDGLDHLEGKTVRIVADGSVMESQEVVGGEVTIERNAFAVEIGLPFTHRVKTLKPEFPGGGTIQGANQSISQVTLRLLDTVGANVAVGGGESTYIDFRRLGSNLLDQPPPSFTGDYQLSKLGWSRGAQIDITGDAPFHLLAVVYQITANT